MPLKEDPASADNIIVFDGVASVAATLNYSVPLPGRFRNRRIIELAGLIAASDLKISSKAAIISLEDAGYDKKRGTVDEAKARAFYIRMARAAGVRGDGVALFESTTPQAQAYTTELGSAPLGAPRPDTPELPPIPPRPQLDTKIQAELGKLNNGYFHFRQALKEARLECPTADTNGNLSGNAGADLQAIPTPRLFAIEYYELSSFLGDYGLGRTVRTYSLFPGEQVAIRLRTWRSSEEKRSSSSTIFDSFDEEVNNRFVGEVKSETTDRQTQAKDESWHAEAKVNATWGWGSAEVSGGGGGQYQSGRDQFASAVNQATQEHARTASSKRDTTVTSSNENTNKIENEESIEREIKNVNLRRVLNFVFRELNQEYLTKLALVDIKIGFSNGLSGSWREVPLSQLRPMLQEVVKATSVNQIAQRVLGLVGTVFDCEDAPHTVLEKVDFNTTGSDYVSRPAIATRDANGNFAPPTETMMYRFRRGAIGPTYLAGHTFATPLSARHAKFQVPGIIMKQDAVTLKTDSVVVEALLGQADALDPYAMISQKADAEAKQLANEREDLINKALSGIASGKERLDSYAKVVAQPQSLKVDLNGGGTP